LALYWAAFAATVGFLLRVLQDKVGFLGKIAVGILGAAWSIATFFAVPVIAYEQLNPIDATKRSAQLVKERWGEGLVANFSLGIITFVTFIVMGIIAVAVSELVNENLGIALFVISVLAVSIITSTVKSIAISAIYNGLNDDVSAHFNRQMLDDLFVTK